MVQVEDLKNNEFKLRISKLQDLSETNDAEWNEYLKKVRNYVNLVFG